MYIHIGNTYTTGPYGTSIGSTYTPTLPLHPPTPLTAAWGPITSIAKMTVVKCYTSINVPTFAGLATPRLTPKSMLNVPLSNYLVPLGPPAAIMPHAAGQAKTTTGWWVGWVRPRGVPHPTSYSCRSMYGVKSATVKYFDTPCRFYPRWTLSTVFNGYRSVTNGRYPRTINKIWAPQRNPTTGFMNSQQSLLVSAHVYFVRQKSSVTDVGR